MSVIHLSCRYFSFLSQFEVCEILESKNVNKISNVCKKKKSLLLSLWGEILNNSLDWPVISWQMAYLNSLCVFVCVCVRAVRWCQWADLKMMMLMILIFISRLSPLWRVPGRRLLSQHCRRLVRSPLVSTARYSTAESRRSKVTRPGRADPFDMNFFNSPAIMASGFPKLGATQHFRWPQFCCWEITFYTTEVTAY